MFIYDMGHNNGSIDAETVTKILDNKLAKRIGDFEIISPEKQILIEGWTFSPDYILTDYLSIYDAGEYIELIEEGRLGSPHVTKRRAIEVLCDQLDQPSNYGNDEGKITVQQRIYNANKPGKEIENLINRCMQVAIKDIAKELKFEVDKTTSRIDEQVLNGNIEWK